MTPTKEPEVSYIPSQLHGPSGDDPVMFLQSPLRLLWDEVKLIRREISYLPYIFRGAKTGTFKVKDVDDMKEGNDYKSIVQQAAMLLWSSCIIVYGASTGLFMPAWKDALLYVGTWALLYLVGKVMNYGPRVLESNVPLDRFQERPDEKWIFVNGICAGTTWLQDNINSISTIFGRPVTGIHNRTYGILFDLLECVIQRDWHYATEDTRETYNEMKKTLLDKKVKRVVVLAHSQGGIIVSSVIDALYADVPPNAFDKLEIYTFGCAAARFCNPLRPISPTTSSVDADPNAIVNVPSFPRQIAAIEHYTNEKDFVARIGVLHQVHGKPKNQYVGRVFTRLGHGGHMFEQHYLANMFAGEDPEFLRTKVRVESSVAISKPPKDEEEGLARATVNQTEEECAGKTVAELSRLWRYKDGKVPPEVQQVNPLASVQEEPARPETALSDETAVEESDIGVERIKTPGICV